MQQPRTALRLASRAAWSRRRADAVSSIGVWAFRASVFAAAVSIGLVLSGTTGVLASVVVLGAGLAGIAIGAVAALIRRVDPMGALIEIESALGTRDRVSSAIAFAASPSGDGSEAFRSMAVTEGERTAGEIDPDRAVPVRWGWRWQAWPGVLVASVALAGFWPGSSVSATESEAVIAQRKAEAAEVVRSARDALGDELNDARQQAADTATQEQLEALDDIERQLEAGEIEPEEVPARAAEQLEDAAKELASESEQADAADEQLGEALDDLEVGEDSLASEFSEALKDGDFERARDAARQMLDRASQADAEERRRLAEDLRRLSEQIEQQQQSTEPTATPEPTRADELAAEGRDKQDVAEQLEREGVDPRDAERLAEEADRRRRESQAEEQAQRDAEDLREALEEAARDVEESTGEEGDRQSGEQPEQQPEGGKENSTPQGERQQGGEPQQQERQSGEGTEERRGEESQQQNQQENREQQGERTGESGEQQQGERSGDESGERSGERSGEQQEQQQQGEQGESQQRGTEQRSTEQGEQGEPGQEREREGRQGDQTGQEREA
ncbi:MAG: hypothetical protein AAGI17_11255, partial [Planctomycetota bacterium]